jgi:DNA-binding NtrC family response regulator
LTARRIGLLEKANHGTLILDEIGETPLDLQGKLLRALQDRKIRRLGGGAEIPLEFRLISTSSRDLKALVREGTFRQDLFYRIAGAVVNVPPLRARAEDIPALAHAYLATLDSARLYVLTPRAIDRLMAHAWPGNLTELRATLRRALVHVGNRTEIDADDLDIVRVLVPPSPVPETSRESEWRPRVRLPLASPDPELRSRRSVHEHVWNDRQKRLLAMLARGDRITTTEYIRLMQVSPRTGLRDLAELVRTGRLRREGRKRGTTYRLA